MCPRFERYRREREVNLFKLGIGLILLYFLSLKNLLWYLSRLLEPNESITIAPVKIYERAAGDKTLLSDLPPHVLKVSLAETANSKQPIHILCSLWQDYLYGPGLLGGRGVTMNIAHTSFITVLLIRDLHLVVASMSESASVEGWRSRTSL